MLPLPPLSLAHFTLVFLTTGSPTSCNIIRTAFHGILTPTPPHQSRPPAASKPKTASRPTARLPPRNTSAPNHLCHCAPSLFPHPICHYSSSSYCVEDPNICTSMSGYPHKCVRLSAHAYQAIRTSMAGYTHKNARLFASMWRGLLTTVFSESMGSL